MKKVNPIKLKIACAIVSLFALAVIGLFASAMWHILGIKVLYVCGGIIAFVSFIWAVSVIEEANKWN